MTVNVEKKKAWAMIKSWVHGTTVVAATVGMTFPGFTFTVYSIYPVYSPNVHIDSLLPPIFEFYHHYLTFTP